VLFSAPIAIQALSRLAGRLPIAGRLALRDLARYQARSGAALAAIALGLGVPVGIVVTASAEESQAPKTNLSAAQLVFRTGDTLDPLLVPQRSADAITMLDGRVQQFAATLGGARVLPLDMAVDPTLPVDYTLGGEGGRHTAGLFYQPVGSDRAQGIPLYVATPQLLQRFGAGTTDVDAHELWFSETTGDLKLFSNKANHTVVTDVGGIPKDDHWQLPSAFVSPAAAARHGWVTTRTGWLVETAAPLTVAQQSAARDLAISAGLTLETMHPRASLEGLRTGATAAGMLLALGVLAMTVGLIRSETAGDLRTLTAAGAGSGMRRKLTAATAGALALLGVVLGIAAAYLALVGAYLNNLDKLANVPVADLAVTILGVPLLAAGAGWLLAGRQPPAIARAALD
jgi:putative ABC transport system permease protein